MNTITAAITINSNIAVSPIDSYRYSQVIGCSGCNKQATRRNRTACA
jgi:hypothetical protein